MPRGVGVILKQAKMEFATLVRLLLHKHSHKIYSEWPQMQRNLTAINSGTRLDWLDALRGVAVLGVVFVHASQLSRNSGILGKLAEFGQNGVQLFFVISALTISMTYESHLRQFGSSCQAQAGWLTKRFFRIAPLYYAAAVFYAGEQWLIYRVTQHRYGHAIYPVSGYVANFAFLHTWIPSANNNIVPGGWSIGVEMFFYLLIPPLYLIKNKHHRMAWLTLLGALLLVVSALANRAASGSFYVPDNSYFYYWFPTQAPVLILGLLFFAWQGGALRSAQAVVPRGVALAGVVICLVVGAILGTWSEVFPLLAPTVLGVAFVLLVAMCCAGAPAILISRPMVLLGQLSYSIYICHMFVLDVVRAVAVKIAWQREGMMSLMLIFFIAVVGSSFLAMMTKRWIEDPAIRYGHLLARRLSEWKRPSLAEAH